MDFHSPVQLQRYDSPVMDDRLQQDEEYLEYRRLVFQELASQKEKRASGEFTPDVEIPTEFHSFALDMEMGYSQSPADYQGYLDYKTQDSTSNSVDELSKDSPSQQPVWDDSDFRTDLILASPSATVSNFSAGNDTPFLPYSPNREVDIVNETTDLLSQHSVNSESDQNNAENVDKTPPLSPAFYDSKKRSSRSHILKQKNDRKAVLQKLSCEDTEQDPFPYSHNKPWYNPKLERLNSQNLKICYINDGSSSSEGEDNIKNKEPNSPKVWMPPSPSLTPLSPTSLRRNMFNRMQSSSSISSTSSGGYGTLNSPTHSVRDIINVRESVSANEAPKKVLSKQEEIEMQARIAFTQAHQEAKRLAEIERERNRRSSSSSFESLSLQSLNGEIRSKVASRSLNRKICKDMSISQLQVILNSMHSEKEDLNAELKTNLEIRDDLRTEQDAKLIDVEDLKAMLAQTGPETTV